MRDAADDDHCGQEGNLGQTIVQDIFYKTPYGRKLHMDNDCTTIPMSSRMKCSKEEVCLVCIDKYIRGKREERQATGGA